MDSVALALASSSRNAKKRASRCRLLTDGSGEHRIDFRNTLRSPAAGGKEFNLSRWLIGEGSIQAPDVSVRLDKGALWQRLR
ncbi:hypothetical protein GCM10011507_27510 [Edaphobacter acidisoli]|uniref:Uncharacterized protein n=1 Tax=Edaphobacter acidisoli TaxID=2040573 RepID=A0A916RWN4_9BACT|nr:hypothetical protein GCM10011507_27510 [Edaphobacter acidisoli]